jgi:peptide/nickel transport system substrate-binding protein
MKKLVYLLLGITLLASLLVAACGGSTTSSAPASTAAAKPSTSVPEASKYGGIMQTYIGSTGSTLMGYPPEGSSDSYQYAQPCIETLVATKTGGTVAPLLATSWDINLAAKTMVFHLRNGVKFHDGSDFNASVVKWCFENSMAAKKLPNFSSVEVLDDYTIKITLKTYQNTDLTSVSGGACGIISKASFDKNGLDYTRNHPIGTGAFKFVELVTDSKIVWTKNPDYWEKGKPYLDGVVCSVVKETTVQKIMLQRGDLHFVLATGIIAQELQKEGFTVIKQPAGTMGLVPDSANANSPFSKLAVRQAVSYAIDREGLAIALGMGFLNPAYQMYPSFATTAIPGLQKTPYDPAKAKQLLKEAGYPNGFKTALRSAGRAIDADSVTAMAKMLTDIGIQAEPDFPTTGKYEEYRTKGWSNALLVQAFQQQDNFNSFFNTYFPSSNIMMPSVKKYDGFYEAVTASVTSPEVDPAKLQAIFKKMNDDLMVIPYGESVAAQFYNKGVHDPGVEEYAFNKVFIAREAWLDASLRK